MPVHDLLDEGRTAVRAGDAVTARRAFERAMGEMPSADAYDGLARVAYLELDAQRAVDFWEQAYGMYRGDGDEVAAIRVARTLAYAYGALLGNASAMNGWLARARTLLPDAGDSVERGWVALNTGQFEADRARRDALFREALDAGRRFHDRDLEFDALAYLGANLVHDDRTEEGMVLLDEALAAVAGGEVDDFCVLEEIFCQLFSACEHAHDVRRADEWIRVGDAIARRRCLPAVSAFCQTHYGAVLTAAGRWTEAETTLSEAVRLWDLGGNTLRTGALVRLADLRVRQGRFDEAAQLLTGLELMPEAARPLAAIQLANGETSRARDTLERALTELDAPSAAAVPLLALLVDVHLAVGSVDDAADAADALAACAARCPTHYVTAVAALARGRVCLAAGDGDPRACLREALAGFDRARMPMELARSRLELATALAGDQPEVAMAEARAALDAFERLAAARDADAAAAVLRALGAPGRSGGKGQGPLTKREAEVLDLLAHGLSNAEISDRLYISRKTVEHHVGSVLAKLGLRSRAEAAAYAARTKPGRE